MNASHPFSARPLRLLNRSRRTGALFAGLIAVCPALAAEDLSYVDLVHRLTDLDRLASPPIPGERCLQWSSYDRASRFDPASGKYLHWDANGDGDGVIRREPNGKVVLAEMEGPGCIWRIWSAAPKEGHVRIHLDGHEEPAIDLPFTGYFDGRNPPFDRKAIVHSAALGWNNYTPIPYQKSCRIEADAHWGLYYHFVYSSFPADTKVPTFQPRLTDPQNAALDEADLALRQCGPRTAGSENWHLAGIDPGTADTLTLAGPGAIHAIQARIDGLPPSPADRIVLRELVLEIRWDGESKPSVWSPFGDFFGTAPGANPYRSLPCGLTEDGEWYANWYMPFSRGAVVSIRNEGAQTRHVRWGLFTDKPRSNPDQLARFHAKWHRDAFLPADPARHAIDWTLLKTTGTGRFVGVMLHIWNPRGSWWGEGDEKFFVDGESFPSTIGTGSEDYFGYAWSNPTLFQHAYHNQTIAMNNRGHISVNRWQITDNIPFQKSFEGAIEKYYPNDRPTLYAATVYWYQRGGQDPYLPVPVAERTNYWDDAQLAARRVRGALEGERLAIARKTGGQTQEQDLAGFGPDWSGDAHLWWTQAKPGDELDLTVPVKTAGRYRLKAQFTRAIDYGIVQLALDGRNLGEPIDFYHDGVVPTGAVDLGESDLSAGDHHLTAQIVGANPKAVKSYMFGFDYLLLEPVHIQL